MLSFHVCRGVVILWFVRLILSSNVTMRSGMACAQPGDITVSLQCSGNERIHVEQESYGARANNSCRFQTNGCRDDLQTSIHGLTVNCNGEQSCNETVTPLACNLAAPAAAEVHYKCIKDSMDICGFDTILAAGNESVYLHSPGYPYSVGMNKSCMARISGKGIQVIIVEQSLNGGNMTITGNGITNLSNENARLYNRKLTGQYSEVAISYTDRGNNRSNVWISVVGPSTMKITFNGGGMITTSTTPTSLVPVSEGSSLLHVVTSQVMSPTQLVTPTSTLVTDTQTLSTVSASILVTDTHTLSTSTLVSTMSTDPVSVTATATVEATSKTTVTTTEIAPTTTADAENMTVGMTTNQTTYGPYTPDASDEEMVVVVASIAASCVVVVIVVVVVAVVLCRCKNDKSIRSESSPHSDDTERPLELNSPNNRKHHNGLPKHDASQHYFIIDPTFVHGNGDVSLNSDSRDNEGTRALRVKDRYSTVLPRSLRLNMNEINTFKINHPRRTPSPDSLAGSNEDNNIEDTELPGTGSLKAHTDQLESVDIFPSRRGNSTKSTCQMTENDIYSGGPPPENHDVSTDDGNQDEESTPEDELYHGEDFGDGTMEGMVDNDIYESSGCDTAVTEQSIGREDDIEDGAIEGMVDNDMYESSGCETTVTEQSIGREDDIEDGAIEGMVDNDMYESSGYDTAVAEQSIERGDDIEDGTIEGMVDNDIYESSGCDTAVAEHSGEREDDIEDDTIIGMVDNDIYESSGYDTAVAEHSGEHEDESATQDMNNMESAEEEADMMSIDLYHSFV